MEFSITITGTQPLLMHSARLADPLDPIAKAIKKITGKRTKTEEDQAEIAHLEFLGSLYIDPDIGPYVPADNIWRCLYDAAKTSRLGEALKRGLIVDSEINPLAYDGPRTPEELWEREDFRHRASIKVKMNRTVRVRPIFRSWKTEAHGVLDPAILNFEDLEAVAANAGTLVGLGDWRPKFGRFHAVVTKS